MSGILGGINHAREALPLAYTRGHLMPKPGEFATQLGYTPVGLYLMDESAHADGLRCSVSDNHLAAVGGVSLYRRWKKSLRGVRIPSASFGWNLASVWNPALASMAVIGGFTMDAHNAANIGLWGYNDTTDGVRLYARVNTATDKVEMIINDVGSAHNATVTIDHALVFGDLYVLAYHINRTTNFLYARLVNVTTGLAYNSTPLDVSLYLAITGTGTPSFHVGFNGAVDGHIVNQRGIGIITAGIGGSDVVGNLTMRLVGI